MNHNPKIGKGLPSLNPGGRPKGVPNKIQKNDILKLLGALEIEAQKRGLSIWEHTAATMYKDNGVLIALMRKLLPDLTNDTSVSELMAELRKRFESETK